MSVAASTEPACERKPTKPSIFSPIPRPVSNHVAATGSRKLPELPQLSSSVEHMKKRDLMAETGLELDLALTDDSDDEVVEPLPLPQNPRRQVIVIPAQQGLSRCRHQFVKGLNKGSFCGKKCVKNRNLCSVHSGQEKKVKFVEQSDELSTKLSETNSKLKTLESLVLGLMKNKDAKISNENKDTSKPIANQDISKPVNNNTNTISTQTNKYKYKPKRSIQKIRIYKLDVAQKYLLVGYRDKMAVFKNKSRLYQVPLPKYMSRPKPNGKWSLVCDEDVPKMVWKEV